MKLLLLLFVAGFVACKKSNTPEMLNDANPTGNKIAMGNFVNNVHPTSGMVSVVESNGKRYLSFENFRTDNGPDLRVYISTGTGITDYQEVGPLKAVSGRFNYELPAGHNTATRNYVLIWCEDFSVLFGHAVLQ